MKVKYWSKKIHHKFYIQCKVIFDKTFHKIVDVHHPYNSNICEGFQNLITKFVPQNTQFNETWEYTPRVNIAACIDSIGYSETYWKHFEDLGMVMSSKYCTP